MVLYVDEVVVVTVYPVFNPVALYEYLLLNMYLFIADITNPD